MTGDFSVRAYPSEVTGFSIYNGKISFSAVDGEVYGNKRKFNITKSMLSNFVIDLGFADGSVDSLYYDDYIAGEHIKLIDNQK